MAHLEISQSQVIRSSMMSKDRYASVIKHIADTDGLQIADTVNHRALETKAVTLEYFQAAARELANIILNRD